MRFMQYIALYLLNNIVNRTLQMMTALLETSIFAQTVQVQMDQNELNCGTEVFHDVASYTCVTLHVANYTCVTLHVASYTCVTLHVVSYPCVTLHSEI